MSVISLEPLELFHTESAETLSSDTSTFRSKSTSSFTPISLNSPTITAVDKLHVTAIDINKHRIVHLQRFRHVLQLVMICSSVCWVSLTLVFLLMVIREISDPHQEDARRQMFIYGMVVCALSVAWAVVTGVCVWRFRVYRTWLNDEKTRTEWIIAGRQTQCRMSGETIH